MEYATRPYYTVESLPADRVTSWGSWYSDNEGDNVPSAVSQRRSWVSDWCMPNEPEEDIATCSPGHPTLYAMDHKLYSEPAYPSSIALPQEPSYPPASPCSTNFTDWRSISGSDSVDQDPSDALTCEPEEYIGQDLNPPDVRLATPTRLGPCHDPDYDQVHTKVCLNVNKPLPPDPTLPLSPKPTLPLPSKPLLIRQLSLKGLQRTLSSLSFTKKRANSLPTSPSEPRSSSSRPSTPSSLPKSRSLTTTLPGSLSGMQIMSLEDAANDGEIKYRGT
ncbi:hypothetical protein QCA50_007189 [Cerrena zonata]|uniref:Uncharacterized protein n=1 Tax=Cerrena zonata TaxID=2478898 RepID=A0AAW0GHJ1_9APHY